MSGLRQSVAFGASVSHGYRVMMLSQGVLDGVCGCCCCCGCCSVSVLMMPHAEVAAVLICLHAVVWHCIGGSAHKTLVLDHLASLPSRQKQSAAFSPKLVVIS